MKEIKRVKKFLVLKVSIENMTALSMGGPHRVRFCYRYL